MSRTLYILDDRVYQNIDEAVRKAMLAELDAIFSFVKNFKVKPTVQASFPKSLDLSDSVVRIVPSDDDGATTINSAWRKQHSNVRKGIKKAGFEPPPYSPLNRFPGVPERHGAAFHAKQVQPAGKKRIAIPFMAGWVELKALKKDADADAAAYARVQAAKAKQKGGPPPKPSTVPMNAIAVLGRYLARAIAHEARHQYVMEHADDKLGTDSPVIEEGNDTRFSKDDQDEIRRAIEAFESLQKGAILIPLISSDSEDSFPF